jgi:flagellar protein FliS
MESSVPANYLETDVLTATPEKRQLMLIEAAIRFIQRTRHHWRAEQIEPACQCLVRAQQIMTELLSALNHQVDPELTGRVAAVYLFVFRRLVDANLERDEGKLDDALRVLEPQREAWEGVCRQRGSTLPAENEAAVASLGPQEPAPKAPPISGLLDDSANLGQAPTGLSLEA